jgi:hypothetical protein
MINGEDILKPSIKTSLSPIPELPTPESDSEPSPFIEKKVELNPIVSIIAEIKPDEIRIPEVPIVIKKQKWYCF